MGHFRKLSSFSDVNVIMLLVYVERLPHKSVFHEIYVIQFINRLALTLFRRCTILFFDFAKTDLASKGRFTCSTGSFLSFTASHSCMINCVPLAHIALSLETESSFFVYVLLFEVSHTRSSGTLFIWLCFLDGASLIL